MHAQMAPMGTLPHPNMPPTLQPTPAEAATAIPQQATTGENGQPMDRGVSTEQKQAEQAKQEEAASLPVKPTTETRPELSSVFPYFQPELMTDEELLRAQKLMAQANLIRQAKGILPQEKAPSQEK